MAHSRIARLAKILAGSTFGADGEFLQPEGRLERLAHFWVLVVGSFVRNRCLVRASALSYTTLLALIPLLAVAISVTSGLLKSQGEDKIYQAIEKFVPTVIPPGSLHTNRPAALAKPTQIAGTAMTNSLPEAGAVSSGTNLPPAAAPAVSADAQKVAAKYIHDFVANTQSGALGFTGTILLVVVAISMFSRIEGTFNDIWGVTRGRNWLLQIVFYWTTMTLGTLLLVAALALAGGSQFQAVKEFIGQVPFIGSFGFQFLPLLVTWLTFALVYQLVPNTKVNFSAALAGGIMGGTLWHLNNIFGFLYVSRVVSNGEMYGKLGIIPVLMIGLYFSWAILLFGAQFAYAVQNRQAYLQDRLAENVNQRGREFVALRLMTVIGARFQRGQPPATVSQMTAELAIPSRLVQQVLRTLLAARLITEAAGREAGYTPARPLDDISAHQILHALRTGPGQDLPISDETARAEVFGEFARIEAAERQAAASVTVLALVNRAQKQIGDAAPPPN